jgi:acyl-CoA synthetase (AMP-forming)/AMP-acid ligase II
VIDAGTFWELIERRAASTPDALFAVDERDRRLSFGEYRARCVRSAAGLAAQDVGPDTHVSWVLPTSFESAILMGALARLGARQNPILPIYGEREIGFITRQSEAAMLIVPAELPGQEHAATARKLSGEQRALRALILDDALPEGDPSALPAWKPGAPSDDLPVRWLFYTSGTTADPKGALHTDATLLSSARGMASVLELRDDDRIALVFPISHVGGAGWIMAGLMSGAAQICVARFDPVETPRLLARHGVTQATAGTAFHQAYLAAQRAQGDTPLFPDVRSFPGGGAPKPPQLHYDLEREMGGVGIVSGYGLTECPIVAMNTIRDPGEKLAHTEGRANPPEMQIRIVRPDGVVGEVGDEGEVCVRGPQLCQGYLDPALNAEAFDDEGFFRTGDLGRLDAEGFLTITGRSKDVIIRNGENISAKEVEDLLHTHPNVAEAAAIGLPDARTGERCCAIVVSREPSAPLGFDEMVRFLVEAGLSKRKLPEQLESIDALPRNATGKILKHALRERYSKG